MKIWVAVLAFCICAWPQSKPDVQPATVQGRVVAAEDGKPLKSARVSLLPLDESLPHSYAQSSDADGNFAFQAVTPGRYRFVVRRPGYVAQSYRATSGNPANLSLASGQHLDKVLFRMVRAAAIVGKVVDDSDEPVSGVQVEALLKAKVQGTGMRGGAQLVPIGMAASNDLGMYRIYGLAPGKYYVAAIDSGLPNFSDMNLMSGGVAMGLDTAQDEIGLNKFPPTFYPGTTQPSQAQIVEVKADDEIRIDFLLQPIKMHSVSGRVTTTSGVPLSDAMVRLRPKEIFGLFSGMEAMAKADSQGQFSVQNVAPGSYVLSAGTFGERHRLEGTVPVEMIDADLSNIHVIASAGITLRGRLVTDNGRPIPTSKDISVSISSVEDEFDEGGGYAEVKPDGTFVSSEVRPGIYAAQVSGLPEGWILSSVRFSNQEVLDSGFKVAAGSEASKLELIVSRSAAQISGTVFSKHTPLGGAKIFYVREEAGPSYAVTSGSSAIELPSVEADQNGQFSIKNLRPGKYYLLASAHLTEDISSDEPDEDEIRNKGEAIELRAKETKQVTLQVADNPQANTTESAPE